MKQALEVVREVVQSTFPKTSQSLTEARNPCADTGFTVGAQALVSSKKHTRKQCIIEGEMVLLLRVNCFTPLGNLVGCFLSQ